MKPRKRKLHEGKDAMVFPLKCGEGASNRINEPREPDARSALGRTEVHEPKRAETPVQMPRGPGLNTRGAPADRSRAPANEAHDPMRAHAGRRTPGGAAGDSPPSAYRAPMLSYMALTLMLFVALSAGFIGAAMAQTLPGTVISNTARIDYQPSRFVSTIVSTASNTVESTVAQTDTIGPIFVSSLVSPPVVDNGGCTVRFSLNVIDSTGVARVYLQIGVLGLQDSTWTHDNGLFGDTTASDSIWNALVYLPPYTLGDTYYLRAVAYDSRGNMSETFVRLIVVDTTPSWTNIRSLGWNLRSDMRIAGNAVSLSLDPSDSFSKVYFEYRRWLGGDWMTCVAGQWSDPNPDTSPPKWGIYWNTDLLADDTYLVRAIAHDKNGSFDSSPGFVRVVKDSRDSWINEWTDTAAQTHVRRQLFSKLFSDTTIIVDQTSITIETKAIANVDSVWIKVTSYPNAPPDAPVPADSPGFFKYGDGSFRRLEREDGLTMFTDSILISFPYVDNGVVGDEERLSLYYFDIASNTWVKVPDSVVEKDRDRVWAYVNHFTVFGVFRALSTNMTDFQIYPNPWKPNDGDPTTGVEYTPGVANTGITFDNLPANSTIRIFTPTGASVRDLVVPAGGTVQWDVKNNAGSKVASGVYIFMITAPSGERITGKLVIIR